MANKIMKTLTLGGNTYEIYDESARTDIATLQTETSQLQATINNLPTDGLDEEALETYLDEKSQNMGTLTINGQQYNGSKDVNVVIETNSGGSSGTETANEEQLATGYIDAETYPEINVHIETGVTLADLKKYKRFLIKQKGASNTALTNFYFKLNGSSNSVTLFRNTQGGGQIFYEWLDNDKTLLKITDSWFGNPSQITAIGSSIIASSFANPVLNVKSEYGGIAGIFDLSELEDTTPVTVYSGSVPTIVYNWEIRGLTV